MKAWNGVFQMPVRGRTSKPRTKGVTMVLDKGLGLCATEDLMAVGADYIDYLKLSFGTSALYDEELTRQKTALVTGAGVSIYPGGTFLEIAVAQGTYDQYLARARDLGFDAIEVSDGTIDMSLALREDVIKRALDQGFTVVSEVGKKDPDEKIATDLMHRQIASDLALGVSRVIVEARESGRGVGIYDRSGAVDAGEVDLIVAGVDDVDDLMWEAPIKSQQLYMINRFGVNVSLGNVTATDVLAVETLRVGLRGDTLKPALRDRSIFAGLGAR